MHAASDFRTIRAAGEGTVEEELVKAAVNRIPALKHAPL
jgi:hypothetical protein